MRDEYEWLKKDIDGCNLPEVSKAKLKDVLSIACSSESKIEALEKINFNLNEELGKHKGFDIKASELDHKIHSVQDREDKVGKREKALKDKESSSEKDNEVPADKQVSKSKPKK
jgi:hypothetical protein